MIRLRDALLPAGILLDVEAATYAEAVRKLAEPLRFDERVTAWPELAAALATKAQTAGAHLKYGVTFTHVRTAAVNEFVMTFGRLRQPVRLGGEPIKYIILIAIPAAMDAEYARLLGVMMRVLRDERLCNRFADAVNPEAVLEVLERGETGIT